jgi:hypothetical protein
MTLKSSTFMCSFLTPRLISESAVPFIHISALGEGEYLHAPSGLFPGIQNQRFIA